MSKHPCPGRVLKRTGERTSILIASAGDQLDTELEVGTTTLDAPLHVLPPQERRQLVHDGSTWKPDDQPRRVAEAGDELTIEAPRKRGRWY